MLFYSTVLWPNRQGMRIITYATISAWGKTWREAHILNKSQHVKLRRRERFSTKRKKLLANNYRNE